MVIGLLLAACGGAGETGRPPGAIGGPVPTAPPGHTNPPLIYAGPTRPGQPPSPIPGLPKGTVVYFPPDGVKATPIIILPGQSVPPNVASGYPFGTP